MKRINFEDLIETEIKNWESRIFFPNEKFRKDTSADLKKLYNKILDSKNSFVTISSETEASVYKIGRFLVESGIKNRDITFFEGDMLDAYINPHEDEFWKARVMLDKLLDLIRGKVYKKWIIIPQFNSQWDKKLALYFISEIQKLGAYGILFYSSEQVPDNLAQVLCEESYMDVLEFPRSRYGNKRATYELEDDGY